MTQYSAEFQMFNDDLRWGRLDAGEYRPQRLIYPEELRFKEWYNDHLRNSFNLKLEFNTVLNKRAIIGLSSVFAYQTGLLATPFHRIYFSDGSQAVEFLPDERIKASIALRWNQFLGGRSILKNTINPYIDDWGILAISVENETAFKLDAKWTILPNVRAYFQKTSDYFAPYRAHDPNADFYTSDFDLAAYNNYSFGLGVKYFPCSKLGKKSQFNSLLLRYNFMHRSNGLNAHSISLAIEIGKIKRNRIL